MLIISYLAYLYNDFLIQRLLVDKNSTRGNPALLSVSAEILSTVLTLGTKREQMVDLRPDFTWTVCQSTRYIWKVLIVLLLLDPPIWLSERNYLDNSPPTPNTNG